MEKNGVRNFRDSWFRSAARRVHWMRFSLTLFALLNVASHIFASPGATAAVTFWLETEIAIYSLIAVVYLLGLRIWYFPAVLYTVLNLIFYFVSAFVAIPGVTEAALVGHIQFAQYSYGRGVSLVAWAYLLVVGAVALRVDRGSKLNDLLADS